jgi:hypothetical protein
MPDDPLATANSKQQVKRSTPSMATDRMVCEHGRRDAGLFALAPRAPEQERITNHKSQITNHKSQITNHLLQVEQSAAHGVTKVCALGVRKGFKNGAAQLLRSKLPTPNVQHKHTYPWKKEQLVQSRWAVHGTGQSPPSSSPLPSPAWPLAPLSVGRVGGGGGGGSSSST